MKGYTLKRCKFTLCITACFLSWGIPPIHASENLNQSQATSKTTETLKESEAVPKRKCCGHTSKASSDTSGITANPINVPNNATTPMVLEKTSIEASTEEGNNAAFNKTPAPEKPAALESTFPDNEMTQPLKKTSKKYPLEKYS